MNKKTYIRKPKQRSPPLNNFQINSQPKKNQRCSKSLLKTLSNEGNTSISEIHIDSKQWWLLFGFFWDDGQTNCKNLKLFELIWCWILLVCLRLNTEGKLISWVTLILSCFSSFGIALFSIISLNLVHVAYRKKKREEKEYKCLIFLLSNLSQILHPNFVEE